jgi:hypothetical protein
MDYATLIVLRQISTDYYLDTTQDGWTQPAKLLTLYTSNTTNGRANTTRAPPRGPYCPTLS